LPAAELLVADDHLAGCPACRLRTTGSEIEAGIFSLRSDLQSLAFEDEHPAYEQIEAYVEDTQDGVEREIVESHLAVCLQCKDEVEDLRAFKSETELRAPAGRVDFKGKLASLWRMPAYRISLRMAGAAAAAILLAWAVTIPLRNKVSDLELQLSELRRENTEMRAMVSEVEDLQSRVATLQQSQTRLLASSGQINLALYDGGRLVVLDNQGNLTGLESLSPSLQQSVRASLASERAEVPRDARRLAGKAGILLSGSGEGISFALIAPVGEIVLSDRPTLRWRAFKGATAYRVSVYDSGFNKVAASPLLPEAEWTVPDKLKRGDVYSWQVTAIKEGEEVKSPVPPAPEARFKVLDQAKAYEIELAKKDYADSHLILGVVYSEAGLLREAEREFRALVAANPQSTAAKKLLASVRR
jgi:hypothetical protein